MPTIIAVFKVTDHTVAMDAFRYMLKSFDDLKRGKAVRNGSIGCKRPAVVD
jgi:hypothetical protein